MPCDDIRKYLSPPTDAKINQLPSLPPANNWSALLKFLTGIKNTLEGQSTNPITPGAIKNFTVANADSGTQLVWDPDKSSAFYALYRNDTNDFTRARVIATVHAAGGSQRPGFFDVAGQTVVNTRRVYWVRGFGPTGVPGPLSTQSLTVDNGIILDDDPWTETLTPGEVRLVHQNNADPVIVRSYGTSPNFKLYHALGNEDNPLPVEAGDTLGTISWGGYSAEEAFLDVAQIKVTIPEEIDLVTTFTEDQEKIGGDSVDGSWVSPTTNTSRVNGVLVADGYLFACVSTLNPGSASGGACSFWRYDLATLVWEDVSPGTWGSQTPIYLTKPVYHDGHVYFGGGGIIATTTANKVWDHDIVANTTSVIGDDATPGFNQCGQQDIAIDSANGVLYCGEQAFEAHVWKYVIATDTWTEIATNATFTGGSGNSDGANALVVKDGFLYVGVARSAGNAQVWRYNTGSGVWTLIGGAGAGGAMAGSVAYAQFVDFATYVYIATATAEVWEWNPDTDTWTKIGGDGVNSSWTTTAGLGRMISYGNSVLIGARSAGGEPEIWQFKWSPTLLTGLWSKIADAPAAGYDDCISLAVDDDDFLYSGMGSGSSDGDLWRAGQFTSTGTLSSAMHFYVGVDGGLSERMRLFDTGDIGFGTGLDGMFWNETDRTLRLEKLALRDNDLDNQVLITIDEDLTANRTLKLKPGNANQIIELSSDTSKLLGTDDSTGAHWKPITIGSGLGMSGSTLSVTASGGAWTEIAAWDFSVGTASIPLIDLGTSYTEYLVVGTGITTASSTTLLIAWSIDNGSNYLTSSGDVINLASNTGVESNGTPPVGCHSNAATAARTFIVKITNANSSTAFSKIFERLTNAVDHAIVRISTASPINAVRITTGTGNITAGKIRVYGR